MTRPTFKMNVETRLIMQEMEKMQVGETITYDRITEISSLDPIAARPSIYTAMRRLLRDKDMVFACVRGAGYKRLNDAEIIEEGSANAERIRRSAARSLERQIKADFDNLTREQQLIASAQASVLGTIAMMSKRSSIEKLSTKIDTGTRELPTSQTLALFMKSSAAK